MSNRLYIDIHVIQTVPPSCVNRDDTGSPKTAVFGGVTRARVSSQAWKKAVRDMFKENNIGTGIRTKRVYDLVAKEMQKLNGDDYDTCYEKAHKIVDLAMGKDKKDKKEKDKDKENKSKTKQKDEGELGALFFISTKQITELAQLAVSGSDKKQDAQEVMTNHYTIDMALFGRMVADDAGLNIDASCQVAHAVSTHGVNNEFDFFTAQDENKAETTTDAGAGMMGTIEYNSSTLYRYATVAVHDLCDNLKDLQQTADAVKNFAEAFIYSMPTGKQNTFANRTLPDAVYIAVRTDQPVNFAGAFEKAVTLSYAKDGYIGSSVKAFEEYAGEIYKDWVDEPVSGYSVGKMTLGEKGGCKEILSKLPAKVTELLQQ
jgi:CRISPR system Cascade subunit CasC